MDTSHQAKTRPRLAAFALRELVVTVVVLAALVVVLIPTVAWTKTKVRTNSCQTNLKHLGTAFALYETENDDRLPPAAWRVRTGREMSWDDWVDWYIGGNLTEDEQWSSELPGARALPYFVCPADDRLRQSTPNPPPVRSYAMPRYLFDRQTSPWPPRSRSRSGVGVAWDFGDGSTPDPTTRATWQLAETFRERGLEKSRAPRRQAAVTMNLVRDPARTILLMDFPAENNRRGGAAAAWVPAPRDQVHLTAGEAPGSPAAPQPHRGLGNYLMVDGRVESLPLFRTVNPGVPLENQSGMWTITPRD